MITLNSVSSYLEWKAVRDQSKTLGFIPTMGALHRGHLHLIETSIEQCEETVVSIFVNPTQFNEASDCSSYPQPIEEDLKLCREAGVTAVFMPVKSDLYPDDYKYRVIETKESLEMEGKERPGHFDGVLTVVMKLFQIVQPTHAYFGEKDWQQLQLVKGMVSAYFMPLKVIACPTIRETDGLALSSRNERLSSQYRKKASQFYFYLKNCATPDETALRLKRNGFEVEYVADKHGRRLGAVRLDGVRLIDNISLEEVGGRTE